MKLCILKYISIKAGCMPKRQKNDMKHNYRMADVVLSA
jgi:hypothetical protein